MNDELLIYGFYNNNKSAHENVSDFSLLFQNISYITDKDYYTIYRCTKTITLVYNLL